LTSKLQRSDGEADWCLSAVELERRRRAFTPWPGLFTHWEGKILKLLDVAPLTLESDARQNNEPGQVLSISGHDSPMAIATQDGLLEIKSVQLEGRRAQSAAEFLRGYPAFIKAKL